MDTIEIDGSYGEGGGQILRTSLTMSLLTGKPFKMTKIRAMRNNPGLAPQHLAAIQSAITISGSHAEGAELKSQELYFEPKPVRAGKYVFTVNTAGAMPLVLHTIFLPLALAKENSQLEFFGGTHVLWAPCFEYLSYVWQKMLKKIGFSLELTLEKAGYYPKGGGHFSAKIDGNLSEIKPLQILERGPIQAFESIGVLSHLPQHIVDREWKALEKGIAELEITRPLGKTVKNYESLYPGNALFLWVEFIHSVAGFNSIGEKGKPVETVAEEITKPFCEFWRADAPIDEHLADQLLLPLAFAKGESRFRTIGISEHLLTNASIIQKFLDVKIEIQGILGRSGTVIISN